MADEAVTVIELPETVPEAEKDMEVDTVPASDQTEGEAAAANGGKREREEEVNGSDDAKKQKVAEEEEEEEEKSVEEERLESLDGEKGTDTDTAPAPAPAAAPMGPVIVGPKTFETSVEMFDYFYKFLHYWPPNLNVNKYEHLALLDLLKKGHVEPEKKIGKGVPAFQVRFHPLYKSRCFFVVKEDGSSDDFSFRKCVDHILPLPENMQIKADVNKALGGGQGGKSGGGGGRGGGRGHWRGRGRGRGGKPRN